ncbi:hypothetical protein TNCV_4843631 [Trichonephila clavipes]|uniref:Uncharacterized protein n=1 Tax=Trichonephila clavipes TaxID=2585209 RepID=A0A8X6WL17_TRICX|nr:hypothetical protein TNCV_4843631 [Trichonephila clavipes]
MRKLFAVELVNFNHRQVTRITPKNWYPTLQFITPSQREDFESRQIYHALAPLYGRYSMAPSLEPEIRRSQVHDQ